MLGDNAPDDRQAETAAAALGGVIRQEQFVALGRRDARSGVGDDSDPGTRLFGIAAPVSITIVSLPPHRFDGVVDQVDDDALHLFGIDSHLRHAGVVLFLGTLTSANRPS